MGSTWFVVTTGAAAVGAGLVGGVFFAFSTFVMPALARLTPDRGADAMRSINIAVITPPFLAAFVGTAVLAVAAAVLGARDLGEASGALALGGALAYLAGVLAVTAGYNVPRNDRLAALADHAQIAAYWSTYQQQWTRANHVRTFSGILAAASLTAAAILH
jgi:uncharacterized membrane protein